jgi:glycosyltransferase involved in cell wall biosynthesis
VTSAARPRLLAVGEAGGHTGFARALGAVLARLTDRYHVVHFGVDYRGAERRTPWRLLPNRVTGDVLGRSQLPEIVRGVRPDVVLCCHDPALAGVCRQALAGAGVRAPLAAWCPVHWASDGSRRFACLAEVDRLVAFTTFGRAAFAAAFRGLVTPPPPLEVIPLGVDRGRFRPEGGPAARARARAALFREHRVPGDAFVLLNANRNTARKRVDLTLRAFALAARRSARDLRLWLHCSRHDPGPDLRGLAAELGMAGRVTITGAGGEHSPRADRWLNGLYTACDAGINTSQGEGWGLVAFEHAATGAAQLVPGHGATAELWEGAGVLLPLARGGGPWEVCVERTAALVCALADDGAWLERASAAALRRARAPELGWEAVAARWNDVLFSMLEQRAP